MKVVFVGPSLPDAHVHANADAEIVFRPPARQGDVMRALGEGATVIALIDGLFEGVAPVWHKELLFALSKGVAVYGASSMGALRAAECAPFGMIGVGRIFEAYRDGLRDDDADVALLHGPAELGYPTLTVPIVNVDATLQNAVVLNRLSDRDAARLGQAARAIFYKERSWKRIVQRAGLDWREMAQVLKDADTDQKRLDAMELLNGLDGQYPPGNAPSPWHFNSTPVWRRLYSASG